MVRQPRRPCSFGADATVRSPTSLSSRSERDTPDVARAATSRALPPWLKNRRDLTPVDTLPADPLSLKASRVRWPAICEAAGRGSDVRQRTCASAPGFGVAGESCDMALEQGRPIWVDKPTLGAYHRFSLSAFVPKLARFWAPKLDPRKALPISASAKPSRNLRLAAEKAVDTAWLVLVSLKGSPKNGSTPCFGGPPDGAQ